MKIGYARVSTEDQNLDLQLDALNRAGCERMFTDHGVSGVSVNRPGLAQAVAMAGPGDVLVVWKLDRLGRSLSYLIELMERLKEDQARRVRGSTCRPPMICPASILHGLR